MNENELKDGNVYPLWIQTVHGKNFYVKVDPETGEVRVGGDADATDAAKAFMDAIGHMALAIPEGWQLVPVEPTPEMVASCDARFVPHIALPVFVAAYKTMLAAAPKPRSD